MLLKSLIGATQLDMKSKNLVSRVADQSIHLTSKGQEALRLRLVETGLTAVEARTWGGGHHTVITVLPPLRSGLAFPACCCDALLRDRI